MGKETGTQGFHQRMDEIERRLQEEREAAETLTQHLASQRNEKEEIRSRELQKQLEIAQQQLKEQKEGAEGLIQQIAAERDESRSQLSGAEARMQKLEQELGAANEKPEEQRKAAESERLIKQLETERDESRSQMNEVEEHMRDLERQIGAAQEQFHQQSETAVKTIRQMATERDESRSQVSEVEDRMQKLEEELAAVQEELRAKTKSGDSPADPQAAVLPDGQQTRYWQAVAPLSLMIVSADLLAMSVQSNPPLLEIVRNIQPQCQNLLELLRREESP